MRALRSGVVGFGAFAALWAVAGCGSSSSPATRLDGVSARSVERALQAVAPPGPTAASCRGSASAEASTVFGSTPGPVFTCELTITGVRASYVVQVLKNGCFVAERRRPGRAVYGCGVERS